MKILILRAGAVGGYFGGRLAQLSPSDCHVTFLVRPNRQEQLRKEGLRIEDKSSGERTTLPNIQTVVSETSTTTSEQFDVIVLTCKAYSLPDAFDSIAPFVHPEIVILPLLNGMAHLEAIEKRFPSVIVWGGTCGIVATLTSEGVVQKMTEAQFVKAGVRKNSFRGEEASGKEDLLKSLIQFMKEAEIHATESSTIITAMWEKWVTLATLGAATSLFEGTVGEILATDYGKSYIQGCWEECHQVATSLQVKLDRKALDTTFERVFGDPRSIVRSSMARDLLHQKPTEANHILGDLIQRAKENGITTPFLSVAFARLQVHENRLANETRQ